MAATSLHDFTAGRQLARLVQLCAVMVGFGFALAATMYELAVWSVGR